MATQLPGNLTRLSATLAALGGEIKEPARRLAAELDPADAAAFCADRSMEIVYPDRLHDRGFRDAIYRSSLDTIDSMWRIIAGREPLETATPLGALEFAQSAAEVGVPVSQFERVYRVGTGFVWTRWYEAAVEYAERTQTPLADLLGGPMMVIVAYIDGLCSPMLERFDATRTDGHRTREQLRRTILREVLEGSTSLNRVDVEDGLAIPLAGEHIAFVVRGERDQVDLVEYVRRSCDASSAITYRHAVDRWVVWLSHPSAFATPQRRMLRGAVERAGVLVALGEAGSGLDGLATTGRQALEASRLQDLLGPEDTGVLSYADVHLEALFLADLDRASRFVAAELGALLGPGARLAALRSTALAWLSSGSHVATAARLGIHEHTVRNRIAQAEELVGFGLGLRRTELLVALRLERMLSAQAAAADARITDPGTSRGGN
jgi:hypothetical protein